MKSVFWTTHEHYLTVDDNGKKAYHQVQVDRLAPRGVISVQEMSSSPVPADEELYYELKRDNAADDYDAGWDYYYKITISRKDFPDRSEVIQYARYVAEEYCRFKECATLPWEEDYAESDLQFGGVYNLGYNDDEWHFGFWIHSAEY